MSRKRAARGEMPETINVGGRRIVVADVEDVWIFRDGRLLLTVPDEAAEGRRRHLAITAEDAAACDPLLRTAAVHEVNDPPRGPRRDLQGMYPPGIETYQTIRAGKVPKWARGLGEGVGAYTPEAMEEARRRLAEKEAQLAALGFRVETGGPNASPPRPAPAPADPASTPSQAGCLPALAILLAATILFLGCSHSGPARLTPEDRCIVSPEGSSSATGPFAGDLDLPTGAEVAVIADDEVADFVAGRDRRPVVVVCLDGPHKGRRTHVRRHDLVPAEFSP